MTTAEDVERIRERMMSITPEAESDLADLESDLAALEESGIDLAGFDPLAFDADPYSNQNIPEGK